MYVQYNLSVAGKWICYADSLPYKIFIKIKDSLAKNILIMKCFVSLSADRPPINMYALQQHYNFLIESYPAAHKKQRDLLAA